MSWLRSRWFGRLQLVIGVAIIVAIALSIVKDWNRAQASGVHFVIRPGWIALSMLLVWTMWLGLIEGWRRIAVGWGAPLRWPLAGRIWMLSSFGKYIPGKVWAMAGMVAISERSGISGRVTLAAAIVMQVLAVGTGIAVAAVTIGPMIRAWSPGAGSAMMLLGLVVAGSLFAVGNRTVLSTIWRVTRREGPPPEPPALALLAAAVVINVITWLAYGLALILLAKGILPEVALGWREATGAFAFAYIVGYLGPTPGGIGARDLALAWFLEHWIGVGPALALAAASRIAFTFNELGAAAPFFFTRESSRDHT